MTTIQPTMTSSMPIPKRKQPVRNHAVSPVASSSSTGGSYTSSDQNESYRSSSSADHSFGSGPSPNVPGSRRFEKSKVGDHGAADRDRLWDRRPKLIGR